MKLFECFLMSALVSFVGQAYGVLYIKSAVLGLLASNCQAQFNLATTEIFGTSNAGQHRVINNAPDTAPLFFSNQATLEHCLKHNRFLSSSWYQKIVPEVSKFFALEQLPRTQVAIASRNIVLSALVRQDILKSPADKSANDNPKQALQRTAHVTNAVIACQTTRESYRKQKQRWKKRTQRDWIHD